MILPECLNLSALPSLPLASRKQLPAVAGIYFAVDSLGAVQYIGRSVNLRQRWLGHHRQSALEVIGNVNIAWLEVSELSLLAETEYEMIKYFKPSLNGLKNKSSRTTKQEKVEEVERLERQEIIFADISEIRFVSWNATKGKILSELRGKKSRQQLAESIQAVGGNCSHQNLKKLEYGQSKMVSIEVLQSLCLALNTDLDNFFCSLLFNRI